MNRPFPFATRQVHLDFHTSPDISAIGSRFSKERFQHALRVGHIDSITVFAKCHHGYCYYPTKVGRQHPQLSFDLTGAMVEAAHEIGVRAPIYLTAGWSHGDALAHPEWRSVDKHGKYIVSGGLDDHSAPDAPRGTCTWHSLCLNDGGAYAEHIYALTREVCERYAAVDGLFFDICIIGDTCYCESCKRGMRAMGLDPARDADARAYFTEKRRAFMERCSAILHSYHPDATVFFNSGGADPYRPAYHAVQTHFEMEDLPTAWGGYDKLPVRAKFFAGTGKPYIGMTGKFHLDWGEFGGYKTKEALRYEACQMALYGAGVSVGDHLHPDGEPELQTYENIGYAYEYLEKIAPFCYGGEPVVNLGVYCSECAEVNEGVANMLLQHQIDFGLVRDNGFSAFDTVIVPEGARLDDAALAALRAYLANGGALLAVGESLVRDGAFAVDMGVERIGEPLYDCDYLVPETSYTNVPHAPLLCNRPAVRVRSTGATVVASCLPPYFRRTYGRFCGHKNTPYDKQGEVTAAITHRGSVAYVAHPLATLYQSIGSLYHREYFINALSLVYAGGAYRVEGLGSQGRVTMIRQAHLSRYCMNMTYAASIKRGAAEVIEDLLPVYNVRVAVRRPEHITRVYLGLTGEELAVERHGDEVCFTVPKLCCHTTVVLDYEHV